MTRQSLSSRKLHISEAKAMLFSSAIFCVLLCLTSSSEKGVLRETYENARNKCSEVGMDYHLTNPLEGSDGSDLLNGKVRHAWLPYKRIVHTEPIWIDDTLADSAILSIEQDLGHACGAIDLQSGQYDFLPCHQQGSSFICQIKGCKACYSVGMTHFECFVMGHDCFTFHCGSSNWYRARESCKKLNGDLVVIKDRKSIGNFKRFWKTAYQSPCSSAWIGLSKEFWENEARESPEISLWAKDEPKSVGNCSVTSVSNGEYVWRAVSCTEKYCYFCAKQRILTEGSTGRVAMVNSSETYLPVRNELSMNILTGITTSLVLVLLLLVVASLFLKYAKTKPDVQNHHNISSDRQNLLNGNSDDQINQRREAEGSDETTSKRTCMPEIPGERPSCVQESDFHLETVPASALTTTV